VCTQAAIRVLKGIINERVKRGLGKTLPELPPNPSIRPTDQMVVVRLDEGEWLAEGRSWKLIPYWVKERDLEKWKSYSTWNARDDELTTKPSWREPFKAKRCLLVMEGFYEKKHFFTNIDSNEMVVAAGLFDDWHGHEKGIHSCTMITTVPNELIAEHHHRMPALLAPESWDVWLNRDTSKENLMNLLRPCPENWLVEGRYL
jgi:putative SOS response-associated peptidase YedK